MFSLFHACHLASCSYRCGATLGGGGGGGEHNLHTLQLRLNSPHVLVGNAMHLPQLGIIMLAALSCAALRKEPVTLTAWQTYLATLRFARSCPSQPALIEEPARFRAVPCWIGEGGGQPGIAGWGRSHTQPSPSALPIQPAQWGWSWRRMWEWSRRSPHSRRCSRSQPVYNTVRS